MKKSIVLTLGLVVSGFSLVSAADAPPAAPATTAPAATASSISVEKISIGSAIDNKEISGEAVVFDSTTIRLYCWTKISADPVPASVKHVWSKDGKEEASVPLEIKYASMRTWSSKSVESGAWKVEVVDDQGKVLASKEFTVH